MRGLLQCIETVKVTTEKKIIEKKAVKILGRTALNECQILTGKSLALQELGTERICHDPSASLAFHAYVMTGSRILRSF